MLSLKRLLGIILVVIIVMFSTMLTTSYAWYSFENASTVFEGVTSSDDIIINYQTGEYINTNIAVPISNGDVDKYSDKNNFNIVIKDSSKDNELVVTVSLVEISISGALQDPNFRVDLYYQGSKVSGVSGNTIGTSGITTKALGTVTLNNDVVNNFEVRVYLLDNGQDQSALMNKAFQAKVKIDVVSRLKTKFDDYTNSDLYVSSIIIDGVTSSSLPTSGYYDMTYSCTKGSNLTWDPLSKTITYNSGSYINDDCRLIFTSGTDFPLLSEMPVGSYVKYVGNNGCNGISCEGYNANYVSDNDMGYCSSSNQQFYVNGWRIGYIEDNDDADVSNDNAVLISAGAPECMCSSSDGTVSNKSCSSALSESNIGKHYDNMNNIALKYCNSDYSMGNLCDSTTAWAMANSDFQKMLGSNLDNCKNKYGDKLCGYTNDLIDNGSYYWFATSYISSNKFSHAWVASERVVGYTLSNSLAGIRPVLRLDNSVVVVDGDGTYENPYIIAVM